MSDDIMITNNSTKIDLRSLNINHKFKQKDIDRAHELKTDYIKHLNELKSFPSESIAISVKKELSELSKDTFYNFTEANNFVDTILTLKEWLKDCTPKLSFTCLENMMTLMKFETNSRYFISNILFNPLDLIQIRHSPISFSIAYKICSTLNIPLNDEAFVDKWCIYAVQDNNGSFYKIKTYMDSKCGWYNLLETFCQEHNILTKYDKFKQILDKNLKPHHQNKNHYADKKYLSYEQELGDQMLDLYYDVTYPLNESQFNNFIITYENKQENNFKFEIEQIKAIKNAIENSCSIITGPPGTGKTTITKAIIEYYNIYQPNTVISLLAPTGKAAKTLIHACNKDGDSIDTNICGTLHKNLFHTYKFVWKRKQNMEVPEKFKKYPKNIDIIIVDEFSMTDIFLYEKLLMWCKDFECKLILVGDENQLPPINKGRPFSQLIKSKLFDITRLNKIKRQDHGLLKDCIVNIMKKTLSMNEFNEIDTIMIPHNFKETNKTAKIFNHLITKYGKDNIITITPEHKGMCGTKSLNNLLQTQVYNTINPYTHAEFKQNDYVMRTKNSYEEDIMRINGDSGQIRFEKPKQATIYYDDPSIPPETISNMKLFENFTLNYCNTVHKYQGSQKKVVILCISPEHSSLKYGNALKLVYTAISRAQKHLIILGDSAVFFKSQHIVEKKFITSFMEQFNEFETES